MKSLIIIWLLVLVTGCAVVEAVRAWASFKAPDDTIYQQAIIDPADGTYPLGTYQVQPALNQSQAANFSLLPDTCSQDLL